MNKLLGISLCLGLLACAPESNESSEFADLIFVGDYDFFLRAGILHQAKFHLIEKNLIKYRLNKNQLSHIDISKTISYLDKVRDSILSELDSDKKQEYDLALTQYKKSKPLSHKTMETGLNFFTKIFPAPITDSILRFYLNKIRTHR